MELREYLRASAEKPLLSPTSERRLARRARTRCKRSRDELVGQNLRLVVHSTKRYIGLGVDLEDLIQKDTFGLIRAAEKFDPATGYRFSAYATWWIRQTTGRAVADKARAIRMPAHYHEKLRASSGAERTLSASLGRSEHSKYTSRCLKSPPITIQRSWAKGLRPCSMTAACKKTSPSASWY